MASSSSKLQVARGLVLQYHEGLLGVVIDLQEVIEYVGVGINLASVGSSP